MVSAPDSASRLTSANLVLRYPRLPATASAKTMTQTLPVMMSRWGQERCGLPERIGIGSG